MPRDAPPRQEDAEMLGAQVRGHPGQFAHITNLSLANLRRRAAEIVICRHSVDFDSFGIGQRTQFPTALRRPVQWIAMRTFPIDLHAVVAKLARSFYQLRQRQSLSS